MWDKQILILYDWTIDLSLISCKIIFFVRWVLNCQCWTESEELIPILRLFREKTAKKKHENLFFLRFHVWFQQSIKSKRKQLAMTFDTQKHYIRLLDVVHNFGFFWKFQNIQNSCWKQQQKHESQYLTRIIYTMRI